MPSPKEEEDGSVAVETVTKKKTARPRLYKVLFHNDDYTTMEFVVEVLMHVFHHTESDAQAIMLHIHHHGVGVAGVYTFEIAETKIAQTMELADRAEFPLLLTLEPDEQSDDKGDEE